MRKEIFKKHPVAAMLMFVLISCFSLLLLAEVTLRVFGHRAGFLYRANHFSNIDSLKVYEDYTVDEAGIFKFSNSTGELVCRMLKNPNIVNYDYLEGLEMTNEVKKLILDFSKNNEEVNYDDGFWKMISRLGMKDFQSLSEIEKAYIKYSVCPINKDGFRSIEFKKHEGPEKRILLIGDSFTYGIASSPVTSSFSDWLASFGFGVYNAGITCTDPSQYEAIAKKYIPILKPDAVVVSFFAGNDIMWWRRKAKNGAFAFYPSNAGFINAHPKHEYLDGPDETYRYVGSSIKIPNTTTNLFNRVCSYTVLTTKLWHVLNNHRIITNFYEKEFEEYNIEGEAQLSKTPVSTEYIESIRNICIENDSKFLLAFIPDSLKSNPFEKEFKSVELFPNIPHFTPAIDKSGYMPYPDGHYNNDGHFRMAVELQSRLDSMFRGQ